MNQPGKAKNRKEGVSRIEAVMQLPRSFSWQLHPLTEGHLGSQNSLVPMELSIMPARGLHALLVPVFDRINHALFLVGRVFLIVKPNHLSCAYHLRWLVYGTITRIGCLKRSCHIAFLRTGTCCVPCRRWTNSPRTENIFVKVI